MGHTKEGELFMEDQIHELLDEVKKLKKVLNKIATGKDVNSLAGNPGLWPSTIAKEALGWKFKEGKQYPPKIMCPKCESINVGQYRMPTGKIWCDDCGFSVPQKELGNPFITKVEPCESCEIETHRKEYGQSYHLHCPICKKKIGV